MRMLIHFELDEVCPDRADVLRRIGIASGDQVSTGIETLVQEASALFQQRALPAAIWQDITADDFEEVYEGERDNAPETPLEEIVPRADALALFAATLGRPVDDTIRGMFDRGDPALGYVLDVTAGCAAEQLAQLIADRFAAAAGQPGAPEMRALAYSPGYCGWHVSGQRALFEHIQPVELGLGLTSSCLMDPVKSVSGVLVAGAPAIHAFRPTFGFCDACRTHACRARIAGVQRKRR